MVQRLTLACLRAASSWTVWRLAMGVTLCGCTAAVVWQRNAAELRNSLEETLSPSMADVASDRVAAEAKAPASLRHGWVDDLPQAVPALDVVQALQNACRESGVAIASLQIREQRSSETSLGRLEVTAVLRGTYIAVKQALSSALSPFPSGTVRSVQWRATDEVALPGDTAPRGTVVRSTAQPAQALASSATELSVVVAVWTAPLGLGFPPANEANRRE